MANETTTITATPPPAPAPTSPPTTTPVPAPTCVLLLLLLEKENKGIYQEKPFFQIVVWTTTSCARNGQLRGNVKLIKPIWTRTVLIPVTPAKHAQVS